MLPCLFIFPSLGTKFGMKGMRPQPQLRVNLVLPGWILETLNDLVVAGKCVGAPAALELQCCGPPPDVSATLSG